MRRRIAVLALAPVISWCLVSLLAAEDAVELKVKWDVGKCYVQNLEMSQEQSISMALLPEPMKQKTTQTQELATSVTKALEDGGRELEMEFRSLKMDIDTPMGKMSFDSTKNAGKDANPLAEMMKKFAGAKVKYVLGADGQVKSVEGFKELVGGAAAENSPFGKMFSEENLKQMCSQSFTEGLPEKAVKKGDEWSSKTELPMGDMMTMSVEMKYTFKGFEELDTHRCAVLESTGTITGKPGKAENPMGMKMSIKEGKASGKIWFDVELGMPRKSTVNHTMKMEMSMMPPGATQAQMSTIDQVQSTSIVLTKVDDIEKKEEKKE